MPDLHFLPGQNYDCVRCAKGCRHDWRIHVDPEARGRIAGSALEASVLDGTPHASSMQEEADGSVTMRRREGHCVYLQDDNLCGIHAVLGVECKPLGCRRFPFMIQPTPDGIVVGVSYFCTAAQQNVGRPLAEHADHVREMLRHYRIPMVGDRPLDVYGESRMEWPAYRVLDGFLMDGAPEPATAAALWALGTLLAADAPDLSADSVSAALLHAAAAPLQDDLFAYTARLFAFTLIGTVEAAGSDQGDTWTEALMTGGSARFDRFGWSGRTYEVEDRAARLPSWVDDEVRRYLRMLVFRKFLALQRPLLDNLVGLYLAPRLFRFYTALSGHARAAAAVEPSDVWRAMDVLELDLFAHTTHAAVDRLLGTFARAYVQQIGMFVS